MALSDMTVKQTKAEGKVKKISDGRGLYLEIRPTGSKYWRWSYRFDGKQKTLAFGVYPDVSLATARQRRDQARALLANGVDPADVKKAQKAADTQEAETFEVIASEWHNRNLHTWKDSHANKLLRRLELYVFPWIGEKAIKEITPPELLTVLRRIEGKGIIETAHRTHQVCGQVFRYAVATGRADRDPSGDLRGAIPPACGRRMATITDPKEIGFLSRICG